MFARERFDLLFQRGRGERTGGDDRYAAETEFFHFPAHGFDIFPPADLPRDRGGETLAVYGEGVPRRHAAAVRRGDDE